VIRDVFPWAFRFDLGAAASTLAECAHVYRTHSRQQFLFSLFSRYSHYASWKTFTYAREDADFSLHPRPPSPPATYIFLSHSFHRSPHIITGAHIHTEVESGSPSIQPSIHRAHSTSFYSFIQSNTWASPSRSSSSSWMHLYASTYSYIRVILKTGVSAAPLSSLSVYSSGWQKKNREKFPPPERHAAREPPRTLYFWGKLKVFVNGRKISVPCYIPFHFLGRSSIILVIDSRAPATGNRWCTRRYWSLPRPPHWLLLLVVKKNTYLHTVCVQEPKNKNYGASSVIFTALGRCAAATVAKVP